VEGKAVSGNQLWSQMQSGTVMSTWLLTGDVVELNFLCCPMEFHSPAAVV
jgi:hypothetical protein